MLLMVGVQKLEVCKNRDLNLFRKYLDEISGVYSYKFAIKGCYSVLLFDEKSVRWCCLCRYSATGFAMVFLCLIFIDLFR
jgi:hypothetical protein